MVFGLFGWNVDPFYYLLVPFGFLLMMFGIVGNAYYQFKYEALKSLEAINCRFCGIRIPPDSKFCPMCGGAQPEGPGGSGHIPSVFLLT